jgi:superoxide dismutase, Fe-Mn family
MNRRNLLKAAVLSIPAAHLATIARAEVGPLAGSKLSDFLGKYPFTLPAIPFAEIMSPAVNAINTLLHHDAHHLAYVNGLNAALAKAPELQNSNLGNMLRMIETIPQEIREDVRFHGGGHLNHALFWRSFTGSDLPSLQLANAVISSFGTTNNLRDAIIKAAAAFRGSGWLWLVRSGNKLKIMTTNLQDNPLMSGRRPVLGIDLWEHAYYPTHQNRRGDYVKALVQQINWDEVERAWNSYN